jgi:DNA repair exonuclease SbcCD ATPase subunit
MGDREELISLIRQVIKEEISDKLVDIEKKLDQINILNDKVNKVEAKMSELEDYISFNGDQIKNLQDNTIPTLERKLQEITESVSNKIIEIDVHRRKWSLIISGLPGDSQESETNTRTKLKQFGKDTLKITNAEHHQMAACHRLAQENDAPIIVRFVDLDERNEWLANAKNLKGTNMNVSISPDIPPILRPLRKDILSQRKALSPQQKKDSRVKYLPRWPYITLFIKGKGTKFPKVKQETLIRDYLGLTT